MNLPERYVNPFTDFGFKKLFGSEPNKVELAQYEESLKVHRDWKNIMDTALDTAFSEGERKKAEEVAVKALQEGLPLAVIAKLTGLSEGEIAKLPS